MTLPRRFIPVALAASAVLAATVGYAALAAPRMAPPPISIATVDLIRLVDKLNERSDWDVQITALTKKIQDELTSKKKAVEDQAAKAQNATEAEKAVIRDSIALQQLQLEQWATFKQAEIDRERALMWQSMYRNIRNESEKLSQSEGFDMVLVNDGVTDLQLQRDSRVPMEQQAQEAIMRRRVLYANKSIDVTDKLILRMNNARSVGGSGAGAPSSSGAAPATSAPSGATAGSKN